jgi:exopolyphosphatase/guanosine-5'-triphosphate,3'-diphosphate pyrophosphatase
VDLGGGSTELIVSANAGVAFRTSLDVGAVRLTERFLPSDPPPERETQACAEAVRILLAERIPDDVRGDVRHAVGVAGTVTTLAALDLGLERYDREAVDGHVLSAEGAARQLERLALLPLAERREIPALEPERAPVIVAGAVIVCQTLEHFCLDGIEATEHDLLDGAALEAAELPEPVEGDAPPGAYTCC